MYVKMCIQNLSWAPATASTRQSHCWIQSNQRLKNTVWHWLHHRSWTGSRGLQIMFLPSGFPSDTEKRQNLSPTVQNSKSLFVCSSQREDLKLFVLWIKEPFQPIWVWEICEGNGIDTKRRRKKKLVFINQCFDMFIETQMSSVFTRCKVKGIHADQVRGLTVYQLKHGQASSFAGQLEKNNNNIWPFHLHIPPDRKIMLYLDESKGTTEEQCSHRHETQTYPSYAHTPVIKLVLCSAEEALAETRKNNWLWNIWP